MPKAQDDPGRAAEHPQDGERPQDDERVMSLLDEALAQSPDVREAWLHGACSGDGELFKQVWEYVRWEDRMRGFLLQPLPQPVAAGHSFAPGELLDGRFRIVREVAHGGMGVIYEALDEKLGRRIALKCALPGFRTRLNPEALNASEISHPNVCRTFEIHTASTPDGDVEFLTMEFVEGQTLTERLRQGPVPENEAHAIALGITRGLAEAHRCHVVHGDLKSNNVILENSPEGEVRAVITDFGLARGTRALARGTSLPPDASTGPSSPAGGTPAYMAPELWKGEKATAASDVYALGVILYELSTGRHPYPPRQGSRPVGVRKLVPAHSKWDRIIARCLAFDPAQRYSNAGEVAEALEPARSWPWWLAAAAALLLAAVSGTLSYNRATAPRDSVRLAVLPLKAGSDASTLAGNVSRQVAGEFARLKGGNRARLTVIPLADVTRRNVTSPDQARTSLGATHVLRGTLVSEGGRIVVHAFLTDTRTQANNAEQEFRYTLAEIGYAPEALAGMVTAALRLPPLGASPVIAAARHDYVVGQQYAHRNSTLDRALPLLDRAVSEDPDSPLTWAGLAEAQWMKYYVTKDSLWLKRCSESLLEAQRRDPDTAPVHLVSGRLKANDGFYERAEAEYLRAIELDPKNADGYRRLGQVYARDDRLGEARAEFLKAVEVEPRYFTACQDLGTFYLNSGELKAAAGQFEHCAQLASDEPDAHRILALVYKDLGRYAEAERESRSALALAETPDVLVMLGVSLVYQSRDREALSYFHRAVSLSPGQSLIWMDLGDAYRRANLPANARDAYRSAMKTAEDELGRDPRDAVADSRLAYICARLGQRGRAEAEIARARQLSPDSNDIREMAVWTWEALGKRQEAIGVLSTSPDRVLNGVRQWPDLADLRRDSRFQELLASHRINLGGTNAR